MKDSWTSYGHVLAAKHNNHDDQTINVSSSCSNNRRLLLTFDRQIHQVSNHSLVSTYFLDKYFLFRHVQCSPYSNDKIFPYNFLASRLRSCSVEGDASSRCSGFVGAGVSQSGGTILGKSDPRWALSREGTGVGAAVFPYFRKRCPFVVGFGVSQAVGTILG